MIQQIVNAINTSTVHDNYTADEKVMIYITNPNRAKRVFGLWASPLKFSVTSKWESALEVIGSMMGKIGSAIKGAFTVIDEVAQIATGDTIQQPWFARKIWKGTDPLQFSLTMRLYAETNAQAEVTDVLNTLLSFVYPRQDNGLGKQDFGNKLKKATSSVTGGLISTYIIPGPSPFYLGSGKTALGQNGDYLTISIGNFFYWDGCFMTKIDAEIPPVVSSNGNPAYAEVTMSFETMDLQYVQPNGDFNSFKQAPMTSGVPTASQKKYQALVTDTSKRADSMVVSNPGKNVLVNSTGTAHDI